MMGRARGKLLTLEEFGREMNPPRSRRQVYRLVKQGRIPSAVRLGRYHYIPRGSHVAGRGKRMSSSTHRGISAREYAKLHGVSRARVYQLLEEGRIRGARRTPQGYDIPKNAPWPAGDKVEW